MALEPVRILLIQSWVQPMAAIRTALWAAGYSPKITRVDFEPAVVAAISRADFDVVVLQPNTPGIPRELVEACLREHGNGDCPLVELTDIADLGAALRAALTSRRN